MLPHGEMADDHLFGLVPIAVQAMLDHGAAADPDDAPEMDTTTKRPYWGATRWSSPRRPTSR